MTKHSRTTSVEASIAAMFTFARLLREHTKEKCLDTHLSLVQHMTLRAIAEGDIVYMRDVAQRLSMTAPSATALIRALDRLGYVRRSAHHDDRRKVTLTLTTKGKRMLAHGFEHVSAEMRRVLQGLSKIEQQQFIHILQKMTTVWQQSANA